MSDTIVLNERTVTKEELDQERQKAAAKPGVKIVEVKPGVYKTQIRG